MLEELIKGRSVLRVESDAGTDGEGYLLGFIVVFAFQVFNEPLAAFFYGLLGSDFLQEDNEFITADAAKDIRMAEVILDGQRHIGEHSIAEQVAEAVVDILKIIGIDDEHGRALCTGWQQAQIIRDIAADRSFVVELGERVMLGLMQQEQLLFLAGMDVAQQAEDDDRSGIIEIRQQLDLRPDIAFPAGTAQAQLKRRVLGGVAEFFLLAVQIGQIVLQQQTVFFVNKTTFQKKRAHLMYQWKQVIYRRFHWCLQC